MAHRDGMMRTTPGGNPHDTCQDLSREHEYRDKLIKLTDMIHALKFTCTMRDDTLYETVAADEWDKFLNAVCELGVDDD